LETMGRTIARVNGLKEKEIMGQRRFSSFRSWKRLRRAPRGWRAASRRPRPRTDARSGHRRREYGSKKSGERKIYA
jgi:hypothetical protein